MGKIEVLLITFFLIFTVNNIKAQHTIYELNGKQTSILKYQVDNDANVLFYQFQKNNGKTKTKSLGLNEVFSIKLEDGKENVFYNPSSEEFNIGEMRTVLQGEYTAIKDYKPYWAFATGFAVGAGTMLVPANTFYALSIPISLNIGFAFISPSEKYINKHYPNFEGDEFFIYGFKQSGKTKILKNTIFGTLVGIATGVVTLYAISELK